MPKKSNNNTKTPIKTLDLDKKIDTIKEEIDKIIKKEEEEALPEQVKIPEEIIPSVIPKKQPKIIEEIVEEEEPEPIIIRKIIKKKPKQIIEEVYEEEEDTKHESKTKKKDGRGRPFGSVKKPKEEASGVSELRRTEKDEKKSSSLSYNNNRDRLDTILDESNLELLRREMKNEMKRRLMSSLFD